MYWSNWNRSSSSRPFLQDAGRHVGMADGAQQNGVERPQLLDRAGRQGLAGPQITLAAEVEFLQLVLKSLQRGDRLQDLEGLRSHFRAGPIAGNHGDLHLLLLVHVCVPETERYKAAWRSHAHRAHRAGG